MYLRKLDHSGIIDMNYQNMILKGSQIVIPHALRKEMLGILHESHFGIEKTCNLAKDIMFWPGMHSEIRDYISKCGICNEHKSSNQKEPMIPSTISELPWLSSRYKELVSYVRPNQT